MSIGDGSTGTMIVSARRTSSVRCLPQEPAGESITRNSVLRGTCVRPLSKARTAAIGAYSAGRCSSHESADAWGSKSASAVAYPSDAKYAARLVAIVLLPQPPFAFVTRIWRMDSPMLPETRFLVVIDDADAAAG